MTDKTKSAVIVKDFRDAGTEERFTKGATVKLSEGAFHNYQTAGLVRAPTAEDAKVETKTEDTKADTKKSAA
jgi:hypothetical protein